MAAMRAEMGSGVAAVWARAASLAAARAAAARVKRRKSKLQPPQAPGLAVLLL